MTLITNQLITGFPKDVQHLVAEYLTRQDLNECMRVSQAWQNLFSSDVMWEPITKKFDIKKKELNSFHQFVNATIVNYIPNFVKATIVDYIPNFVKNQFLNDYKSLAYQKLLLEEQDFQKKYPEFVKVFDGITAIRHLPTIEVTPDELINEHNGFTDFYYFDYKHFTSPIVRAIVKWGDNSKTDFILLRIRNNATGEIYRDAISVYSLLEKMRFFKIDITRPHDRVICSTYSDMTAEKLDRLQRLIQGKPVGIIDTEERYSIVEGPKTIANGNSTLELF
jgi:Dynamin GTPase effector domain